MKRRLKIRFVEVELSNYSVFYMEYKKLFFWKTNWVAIGGSTSGVAYDRIYSAAKPKCLAKNLQHMSLCKDYLKITEYPTIKIY